MKLPLLLLALASFSLAGCEEEGPAERLGRNIDEGAEEARDAVEDSVEALEDDLEQAGEELEDAGN